MQPCNQVDKISEIHSLVKETREDFREFRTAFDGFRLNTSVDVATLNVKSKNAGKIAGTVWGIVSAILVGAIIELTKKGA